MDIVVGDKVNYKGRGILPRNIVLNVMNVEGNFLRVKEHPKFRYKLSSFTLPNRKVDKPKLDLLNELIERVKREGGIRNVCSYALEFENDVRRFQVNDICHARLTVEGNRIVKNVALYIGKYSEGVHKEVYKRFVKYIIDESPWRNAFKDRYNDEMLNTGVYLDVTKPHWYCVSAAIALRSGNEHRKNLPMFDQLLRMGFSPNVSYLSSQLINSLDKYTGFTGGHHVFSSSLRPTDFTEFFDLGLIKGDPTPFNKAQGRMYKVFEVIGLPQMDDLNKYLFKKNEAIVISGHNQWNHPFKYIDLSSIENKVYFTNTIARLIK